MRTRSRKQRLDQQHEDRLTRRQGSVLLEVVLALALFVAAAAVIGTGLGQSVDSVERQRLNLHAANLAGSVLAELQLGLRTPGNGPEAFAAPFEHWSWEIHISPVESDLGNSTTLTLAEAIVRHDDPEVVHRVAEVVQLNGKAAPGKSTASTRP